MSSFGIKLLAIALMLIDHIGAILFPQAIILRIIGRLAFPLFVFLLVQGFIHTKNIKNYAARLGIFALISEIPYDLAFSKRLFDFSSQNVFFTLLIGLLVLYFYDKTKGNKPLSLLIITIGISSAFLLRTDYAGFGVLLIILFYSSDNIKKTCISLLIFNILLILCSSGSLFSAWRYIEIFSLLSVALIYMYNNKKGRNIKYLFYVFYPAHLLLLFIIGSLMKQILPLN